MVFACDSKWMSRMAREGLACSSHAGRMQLGSSGLRGFARGSRGVAWGFVVFTACSGAVTHESASRAHVFECEQATSSRVLAVISKCAAIKFVACCGTQASKW